MTGDALSTLRQTVAGTVVQAGEPGYDECRTIFNARSDRRPAVLVRCASADDVAHAVRFARAQRLPVSVKSGGHSYAANTVGDGSVLIDLSGLTAIAVDPGARTARVAAGATWGEVDAATQQHGLATPSPTVSSVGVAGSTLGGGGGYLTRKHGLALDNLRAVDIVTADGELRRASDDEHPDLYWAVRGGAGNVGVVTAFEFQLHDVGPDVFSGQVIHRFEAARDVLRMYRDFMRDAADEIMCYAAVFRVPPIPAFPAELHGEIVIDLIVFHASPDGEPALRLLLDYGDPILKFAGAQPYTAVQKSLDAGLPAGQRYESRSHDFTELTDEAIDAFTAQVGALPGAFTMTYFIPAGGAIGRVAPTSTAFPHRDIAHSWHTVAGWTDAAQDAEVTAWIRTFDDAMAPFATGGVYVNLLGTDEADRVRQAYGENYARLVELKRTWDPDNVFRFNHNVRPHP